MCRTSRQLLSWGHCQASGPRWGDGLWNLGGAALLNGCSATALCALVQSEWSVGVGMVKKRAAAQAASIVEGIPSTWHTASTPHSSPCLARRQATSLTALKHACCPPACAPPLPPRWPPASASSPWTSTMPSQWTHMSGRWPHATTRPTSRASPSPRRCTRRCRRPLWTGERAGWADGGQAGL